MEYIIAIIQSVLFIIGIITIITEGLMLPKSIKFDWWEFLSILKIAGGFGLIFIGAYLNDIINLIITR